MGAEGEKLAEVAEEYEKSHPHITVKVTPIGWDVAHQKLVSAAAAGKLPDVMQMGGSYMGEFAELGVLEPVDTKTFNKDDFFPAAWTRAWYDGKVYGVPWYVDTRVLYYRTDLAKKAGINEGARPPGRAPGAWPRRTRRRPAPSGACTSSRAAWTPCRASTPSCTPPAARSSTTTARPPSTAREAVKALKEYGTYFDKGLAKK